MADAKQVGSDTNGSTQLPTSEGYMPAVSGPREDLLMNVVEKTDCAKRIIASGRHPVILFGTAESGKSTILVSLLNAMARNDLRINMTLGERIFSSSDEEQEMYYQRAIEFFQRYTRRFAGGELLPQTVAEKPFFIPIDIVPPNGPGARFAFLEGSGEWISPLPGKSGALINDLKPDIVDILKHFDAGLSLIYVAPFAIGEAIVGSTIDSDTGLSGAIERYEHHRNLPDRDNHLFLLTKWDACAEPLRDDPRFAFAEEGVVEAEIRRLFPQSWRRFGNMRVTPNSGRRVFMQYSAGLISDGQVREAPRGQEEVFARYPRTVWNWLYTNAMADLEDSGVIGPSRVRPIFPDVRVARPPLGLLDRLRMLIVR